MRMVRKIWRDGTHRNISTAWHPYHCPCIALSLCWPRLDSVRTVNHRTVSACCATKPDVQSGPHLRLICLALAMCLLPAQVFADQSAANGDWIVGNKQARIRVVDCAGSVWGVISWEEKPGFDTNNPDPAKRSRPMLGVPIVLGMKPAGPNKWTGAIYNSAWGKTFSGGLALEKPDTLRITGCLLGFLCGGENWSRATEPPVGKSLEETDQAICRSVRSER
jgi:uncharacterized protein (DUF2147 family)